MNTNILTWAVALIIIISLIIFFRIQSRKSEKKVFSILQSFAGGHNCTISAYDHWDESMIGLDNREINRLFFIRKTPDREFREVIDLSEVKSCWLHKAERTIQHEMESDGVIDRIELAFSFHDSNRPDLALEFYNNAYNPLTLTVELQLAEKWSEEVRSILLTNKNLKSKVVI